MELKLFKLIDQTNKTKIVIEIKIILKRIDQTEIASLPPSQSSMRCIAVGGLLVSIHSNS
jgi:hypothetical protein